MTAGSPTRDEARRTIDDLVSGALIYRPTGDFRALVRFLGRFRQYSPFNSLLLHLQRPGAAFVAPAHRWREEYHREVRPGERPLIILQPGGPVLLVYDVSQTAPVPGKPERVPDQVSAPFSLTSLRGAETALGNLIESAKRDGIRVHRRPSGAMSAGCVFPAEPGHHQLVRATRRPYAELVDVPVRYEVVLNESHGSAEQFATLAHEIGHVHCGHLGPDLVLDVRGRGDVPDAVCELEAEAVATIVCLRLDPSARFPPYLEGYLAREAEMPEVLLDRIVTAAGDVLAMSLTPLALRKPRQPEATRRRRER